MLAQLIVMWLVYVGKGDGDYISFNKGVNAFEYYIYKTHDRIWAIQTRGSKLVPFATFGSTNQYKNWLHKIKK
jgi:hypothetical protein